MQDGRQLFTQYLIETNPTHDFEVGQSAPCLISRFSEKLPLNPIQELRSQCTEELICEFENAGSEINVTQDIRSCSQFQIQPT